MRLHAEDLKEDSKLRVNKPKEHNNSTIIGVIIAIIVIAMILIIGIGGTCLYMFTDLFKSEKTLNNKLTGRTEFTRIEMVLIKKNHFPNFSLEYLFEVEPTPIFSTTSSEN